MSHPPQFCRFPSRKRIGRKGNSSLRQAQRPQWRRLCRSSGCSPAGVGLCPDRRPPKSPVPGSQESLRQGRARLLVQRSSAWECTDPPTGGLGQAVACSPLLGTAVLHQLLLGRRVATSGSVSPYSCTPSRSRVSREPALQGRHGNPHWHLPLRVGLLVTLATCTLLFQLLVYSQYYQIPVLSFVTL